MVTPVQAKNEWLVLVFLSLGFFMILLDTTIVNIAIPAMISGLNSSLDQILWVINAYLLAYAVLLITAGRLGDFFGPRRLFALGLAIFTVASALCGLAQDGNQLIAARILQGVGGAILTPQTLSIITGLVEGERFNWGAIWGPITIPEIIAAGVVLFAVFVVFERFQAEPLMPLSLFSNRNFSISIWVSSAVAFGMLGFFIPVTIFF